MLRLYGQRMLNPFHGVINVIEIDGADALTRDGREWMLYLHGEAEEEQLADGSACVVRTPDIKFGTWSETTGLKRAPVRQVVDYDQLEIRGQELLSTIRRHAKTVPFPLRDQYELWVLETRSHRPIALLDSSCDPPVDTATSSPWRPGRACLAEFRSSRLSALEADINAPDSDFSSHGERLSRLVARATGNQPAAQWFLRRPDGSSTGIGGQDLKTCLETQRLPTAAFPPLQFSTDWINPADAVLAEDFLEWQAPWLLQLQAISPETRSMLEQAAAKRPLLTARMHRLYPEVQDVRLLKKILVEARFKIGDTEPTSDASNDISPDCIELWPPGD